MERNLWKISIYIVIVVCLVSCGKPPIVYNAPTQMNTPLPSQQSVSSMLDANAETSPLSYKTEQNTIEKEPVETMLYTIDFDAKVSRLVSSILPNITVHPKSLRDEAESAVLPEDYVLYYTQHDYTARCVVCPSDVSAEFDANASNRWEEESDYPGVLTEGELIEHAYQWAQTLGIDIDAVVQTSAYGKENGTVCFRHAICSTKVDSIPATIENINASNFRGQYMVYMENEEGAIQMYLSQYEIVNVEAVDIPLLSLEEAVDGFFQAVDSVSEATPGSYRI